MSETFIDHQFDWDNPPTQELMAPGYPNHDYGSDGAELGSLYPEQTAVSPSEPVVHSRDFGTMMPRVYAHEQVASPDVSDNRWDFGGGAPGQTAPLPAMSSEAIQTIPLPLPAEHRAAATYAEPPRPMPLPSRATNPEYTDTRTQPIDPYIHAPQDQSEYARRMAAQTHTERMFDVGQGTSRPNMGYYAPGSFSRSARVGELPLPQYPNQQQETNFGQTQQPEAHRPERRFPAKKGWLRRAAANLFADPRTSGFH